MYPAHICGVWVRHRDMSVRSVSLCVTVCVVCRVYGPVGRVWLRRLLWHTRPVYEWTLVTVQWTTSSCICTTPSGLTPNHLTTSPPPIPHAYTPLPRGLNSKTAITCVVINNNKSIHYCILTICIFHALSEWHTVVVVICSFVWPHPPPPTPHTLNGNYFLNINKRHAPVVNNIHKQPPHPSETLGLQRELNLTRVFIEPNRHDLRCDWLNQTIVNHFIHSYPVRQQ